MASAKDTIPLAGSAEYEAQIERWDESDRAQNVVRILIPTVAALILVPLRIIAHSQSRGRPNCSDYLLIVSLVFGLWAAGAAVAGTSISVF